MSTTAVQDIEAIQRLLKGFFPDVEPDGDIGRRTNAALRALVDHEAKRQIQGLLRTRFPQVLPDGVFGPITYSALDLLDDLGDHESLAEKLPEIQLEGWRTVTCSSFADPGDIRRFQQCKAAGGTDMVCFRVGDNGRGKWGADCTADRPMVALPREVWRAAGKTGGDLVLVCTDTVDPFEAELGDTMPALENIHNGAGMDGNPATVRKLGQTPPMMLGGVRWRWAA